MSAGSLRINSAPAGSPDAPLLVGPVGNLICFSYTRPPNPYNGLGIYEKDTEESWLYYNGWKRVGGTRHKFRWGKLNPSSVSNNSDVVANFDIVEDNRGVSSSIAADRVTIARDGYWDITLEIAWQGTNSGRREVAIMRDRGSVVIIAMNDSDPAVNTIHTVHCNFKGVLQAGDQLFPQVRQDSGGSLNINANDTFFSGYEVF